MAINLRNVRKLFQMVIKYANVFHSNALQKYVYPIWDFWYESKPSGNPDTGRLSGATRRLHMYLELFVARSILAKSIFFEHLFWDSYSVTRLGEFSPIFWLFTLGNSKTSEIGQIFGHFFSTENLMY
jgi:hypothetical protein